MRPEVVADQNVRAEKQRTCMQVIGANPALGARALQDLLAAERVVAATIATDLGMDQTDLQPPVAAAVNALRGAFMGSCPAPAATPATASGLPAGPWGAVSHQSHGTSIRSVPRDNPTHQVGRAISSTNYG